MFMLLDDFYILMVVLQPCKDFMEGDDDDDDCDEEW
jgi:hypothetical protein